LKDVALEVIHRAERREQQRKEIARLQATLKSVQKHQEYIQNQIGEFERYLQKCRENAAKKLKTKKHKHYKFTVKELQKKGVILGAEGELLYAFPHYSVHFSSLFSSLSLSLSLHQLTSLFRVLCECQ
jgi:vacuolar-type H+-ATPase subunit E/Vma4